MKWSWRFYVFDVCVQMHFCMHINMDISIGTLTLGVWKSLQFYSFLKKRDESVAQHSLSSFVLNWIHWSLLYSLCLRSRKYKGERKRCESKKSDKFFCGHRGHRDHRTWTPAISPCEAHSSRKYTPRNPRLWMTSKKISDDKLKTLKKNGMKKHYSNLEKRLELIVGNYGCYIEHLIKKN